MVIERGTEVCQRVEKGLVMCKDGILRVAKENKLVVAAGGVCAAAGSALADGTNYMADITTIATNGTTAFSAGWGIAILGVGASIVLGLIKWAKRGK